MSSGAIHPGLLHEILDYLETDDLMKMIKGGEDVCCVSREATEILENRFETENGEWSVWAENREIVVRGAGTFNTNLARHTHTEVLRRNFAGLADNLRQVHLTGDFGISLKQFSRLNLDLFSVNGFTQLIDLEGLENVRSVKIKDCYALASVRHLKKAQKLMVHNCANIMDYDVLHFLTDLKIVWEMTCISLNDSYVIHHTISKIYKMRLSILSLKVLRRILINFTVNISYLNVSTILELMGFTLTGSTSAENILLYHIRVRGCVAITAETVFTGLNLAEYNYADVFIDATNMICDMRTTAANINSSTNKIKIRAQNLKIIEYHDIFKNFYQIERVYDTLKLVGFSGRFIHDKQRVGRVDATTSPGLEVEVDGEVIVYIDMKQHQQHLLYQKYLCLTFMKKFGPACIFCYGLGNGLRLGGIRYPWVLSGAISSYYLARGFREWWHKNVISSKHLKPKIDHTDAFVIGSPSFVLIGVGIFVLNCALKSVFSQRLSV